MMKLEDCKKLRRGDKVLVRIGRNEYQTMTFLKLVEVISYGKATIEDFLRHGLSGKGRHLTEADCEFITDSGYKDRAEINLRSIIAIIERQKNEQS